jgi:membrane protease YdiL (CAAX protease family)
MKENKHSRIPTKPFWSFMILTYLISWAFWIPVALSGQDVNQSNFLIPYALGGFGPSIAGIIMVYKNNEKQGRRDFWRRVVDFKRISTGWYLFIFLIFPFLFATAFMINSLQRAALPNFAMMEKITSKPLLLIGIIVTGILTGPLSEELGWRGYAMDRLQTQRSPLISSLILALFWWAWHLPLFFIKGTTQYKWGFGTSNFWYFMITIIPLTLILTWVYNHTNRSILAAVLLHFMYNFTLGLVFPLSENVNLLHVILLSVAAMGLVITLGWKKLDFAPPVSLRE